MLDWFDDPLQRARAAADPACPPAVLQSLATAYPELRPLIATNSASYPALLGWLASLGDLGVDAALAARAAPQVPARGGRRPWRWWVIGASIAVVVVLVATVAVSVAVPVVTRSVARAGSPFAGTPGSVLLTQAEVRAATKKSDGIFDGDPESYTLSDYIDLYSYDQANPTGDQSSVELTGSSSGSTAGGGDEQSAPAGCWDDVTGFLSLPGLDNPDYRGYRSDRIWSIEQDSDGGTEQVRKFVDASSAARYFQAEKNWYSRCHEIVEFTKTPDQWDEKDDYTSIRLTGLAAGVTAIAFTDAYHDNSGDPPDFSVEVYLLHGSEVEALNFFPDDTSGSYVASPTTAEVVTAAAKQLAAGY